MECLLDERVPIFPELEAVFNFRRFVVSILSLLLSPLFTFPPPSLPSLSILPCSLNPSYVSLNSSQLAEWNPDPIVSSRAEHLYGHIDNLELFPGLHAEAAKPSREGSGLATNYTISRSSTFSSLLCFSEEQS